MQSASADGSDYFQMAIRVSSRHWLLLGGTVGLAAMGAVHSSAQSAAPRAAVTTAAAGRVVAAHPSVSADGSVVAFEGSPPDGAAADRASTVWVRDLTTGSTTELTPSIDGSRAGESVRPVVSADGCRVAVITQFALDLFRDDDTGDRWDVYVTTLPRCGGRSGAWELVSTRGASSVGTAAADDVDPTDAPAVSAEGAVIAYTHLLDVVSDDLGEPPALTGVAVVDLTLPLGAAGRVHEFPGTPLDAPDGLLVHTGVRSPAMSDDGSVVTVTSDVDHATGTWSTDGDAVGTATARVAVWDRTVLDPSVAVTVLPAEGADDSAVSRDGSVVAFVSADRGALPAGVSAPACALVCPAQVYLWHRADGSVQLASAVTSPDGTVHAADGPSSQPVLDRTGSSVVFVSRATNLLPRRSAVVGGPDDGDIVQVVPATGTVRRLSLGIDGTTPLPATNAHPTLSADGRVVVFDRLGGPSGLVRDLMVVRRTAEVVAAGIDLGTVAVGFPGPEWYVAVHNVGVTSFRATEVESDSDEFMVTGGTCIDGEVPAGGTCTVFVVFVPERQGVRHGVVTITDGAGVEVEVPLSGRGGEPELDPLPAGADAAPTVVGATSEPVQFTITNIAFHRSTITSIAVAGANPDDFAVSDDQCTGRRLDALDTCTIDVVFSPTAAGRRAATVVATTDRGADSTMLIGGVGRWAPLLEVTSPAVVAPGVVTARGTGFAAGADVLVGWADGVGSTMRVVADESGSFTVQLVVRPNERAGARTMVAQTLDGTSARADVLVLTRHTARGPASPRWPD